MSSPFLIKLYVMEAYGERRYNSTILDLDTSQPPYRRRKRFGTHYPFWTLWSKQKSLVTAGNRISDIQPLAPSYVLRRIFGPKRDEVTGEWRKLHNEELHNLYSSPNIIRTIK
jgi:hypothetical protein